MKGRTIHVMVVLVAAGLLVAACGRGDDSASRDSTPGFTQDSTGTPAGRDDGTAFEMANPTTTQGPTTIPGAGPTLPLPTTTDALGNSAPVGSPAGRRTTPRRSAADSPYQTPILVTTTTTPSQMLPPPPDGTFCGFSAYLQSMISVLTNKALDARAVLTGAMPVVKRMQALAPAGVRGDIDAVVQKVQGLIDLLASVGWNIDAPEFRAATNPLIAGAPDVQPFIAAYDRVSFAESTVCQK